MSSNSTKKTSGIFATLFIGLIVVSFMFSGYQGMRSTPDTIAKVGKKLIKISEYQRELDRQMNFFKAYYNGGKALSKKQIEQFRLKESAMSSLINSKLKLIAGEEIGIFIGDHQVQEAVMNYSEPGPDNKPNKIFFTNGQFDITKYKALLNNSRQFTPSTFEDMIRQQTEMLESHKLFDSLPVSDKYAKEYTRMKSESVLVDAVKIEPSKLLDYVQISKEEINKYLKDEINLKRVKALFKERQARLDKPEKVQARHILFTQNTKNKITIEELRKKLNKKNFAAMAKEYSDEPNADKSGGNLGWFTRGKMVPEFENVAFAMSAGQISEPIKTQFGTHIIFVEDKKAAELAKFEDHKISIAEEQLKKHKDKEAKELQKDIIEKITIAMKSGKTKTVENITKKYALSYESNQLMSKLEHAVGNLSFSAEQASEIFKKSSNELFVFDKDPMQILIAFTRGEGKKDIKLDQETKMLANAIKSKLQKEITEKLGKEVGHKIFGEL